MVQGSQLDWIFEFWPIILALIVVVVTSDMWFVRKSRCLNSDSIMHVIHPASRKWISFLFVFEKYVGLNNRD